MTFNYTRKVAPFERFFSKSCGELQQSAAMVGSFRPTNGPFEPSFVCLMAEKNNCKQIFELSGKNYLLAENNALAEIIFLVKKSSKKNTSSK